MRKQPEGVCSPLERQSPSQATCFEAMANRKAYLLMKNPMYVQIYKIGDGEYTSVASQKPIGSKGCVKTYEIQSDGSLVEYVKPERMFALQRSDGLIYRPQPQSTFAFCESHLLYFEVMPDTGDYRRIPEEERKQLEAEA